jgi:hypothetical protein
MSRKLAFVLLFVLFVLVIVPVVAKEGTPPSIPVQTKDYGVEMAINDGRLNGLDVAAPVAVYVAHQTVFEPDPKHNHFTEIDTAYELLAIDPKSNNGYLVLRATADDVQKLMKGEVPSIESNGYTLNYSPSDWFWITAPPDKEGKVYSFKWQNHEFPLLTPQ